MGDKRRCGDCKFYYRQDYGYSNYTVEETVGDCLKGLNPNLPAEEGYSWENKDHEFMRVAEQCAGYSNGDPLEIDCDQENMPWDCPADRTVADYYTEDAEVLEAFRSYAALQNREG